MVIIIDERAKSSLDSNPFMDINSEKKRKEERKKEIEDYKKLQPINIIGKIAGVKKVEDGYLLDNGETPKKYCFEIYISSGYIIQMSEEEFREIFNEGVIEEL